jgi:hypothetical protein
MGIFRSEIGKILGDFHLGVGWNFGPKSDPLKKTLKTYKFFENGDVIL